MREDIIKLQLAHHLAYLSHTWPPYIALGDLYSPPLPFSPFSRRPWPSLHTLPTSQGVSCNSLEDRLYLHFI